jgi:hypothetical protein
MRTTRVRIKNWNVWALLSSFPHLLLLGFCPLVDGLEKKIGNSRYFYHLAGLDFGFGPICKMFRLRTKIAELQPQALYQRSEVTKTCLRDPDHDLIMIWSRDHHVDHEMSLRHKSGHGGIFRSSSSTTNPVCERRVDLLVCSLPLHRHSCIGFILAFASSIHNKQSLGGSTRFCAPLPSSPSFSAAVWRLLEEKKSRFTLFTQPGRFCLPLRNWRI